MISLLITGSDTGVGKTHVVAALARLLAHRDFESFSKPAGLAADLSPACSRSVQIVKVVESGRAPGSEGDADRARHLATYPLPQVASARPSARAELADPALTSMRSAPSSVLATPPPATGSGPPSLSLQAYTLTSFAAPLAPAAAAAAEGKTVSFENLVERLGALPACAWRLVEGAGGIATPIDADAHDWLDFAIAAQVDAIVVVVPDRLGAINQARLAYAHARQAGIPAGVWLNATAPVDADVATSTRSGLAAAGIPIWGEQTVGRVAPSDEATTLQKLTQAVAARPPTRFDRAGTNAESSQPEGDITLDSRPATTAAPVPRPAQTALTERCGAALAERDRQNLRRTLRVTTLAANTLNLAGNDYLALADDRAVAAAVAAAALRYGTSASASPLITGWREPHEQLVQRLATWHGFSCGLLWSSGYAANAAVLSGLPRTGDRILADRLIHHSMIAGLQRSGARFQRYEHLNLDRLEHLLEQTPADGAQTFVVTESVFSMDGDYPDLGRMAALKRRFGFVWIVDEAHALGWYGPQGAGLVRAAGVIPEVDVLVGTFGKTLASGGAYTLFHDVAVRDFLVNTAGEFIYSTALPPTSVAAAHAAIERVTALSAQQRAWQATSRQFRAALRDAGWDVPVGDSPIVPIRLDDAQAAMAAAAALRASDILVGAVRPPTVPAGTSRLRLSLQRTFSAPDSKRVLAALEAWRRSR